MPLKDRSPFIIFCFTARLLGLYLIEVQGNWCHEASQLFCIHRDHFLMAPYKELHHKITKQYQKTEKSLICHCDCEYYQLNIKWKCPKTSQHSFSFSFFWSAYPKNTAFTEVFRFAESCFITDLDQKRIIQLLHLQLHQT